MYITLMSGLSVCVCVCFFFFFSFFFLISKLISTGNYKMMMMVII